MKSHYVEMLTCMMLFIIIIIISLISVACSHLSVIGGWLHGQPVRSVVVGLLSLGWFQVGWSIRNQSVSQSVSQSLTQRICSVHLLKKLMRLMLQLTLSVPEVT